MEGRQRFNDDVGSTFVVEVAGERFSFTDCYTFAELGNLQAGIEESVLKTLDARYIRLTVVAEGQVDAYGIRKGWYTALMIDAVEAAKWREAWSLFREQPTPPMGPWA